MTTIVLADDEDDIRDSTSQVLEVFGFEVTSVGDASKIFATVQRVRPDILLQDVHMPDLDLVSLLRDIKADKNLAGVRILIFTASGDGESIATTVGADGQVAKPFEAVKLKGIIDQFMALKPKGMA